MAEPTIEPAETAATKKVTAAIVGAEPRTYHRGTFIPRQIVVHYANNDDRGWRALPMLIGPQVRKDGSVGTREIVDGLLGPRYGGQPIPEWVTAFVEEHHPLAGAAVPQPPNPEETT